MRELKVLDLTKMSLSPLRSSINLLTSLQTLCMDQCELGDIAVIGELKNLEILSFKVEFPNLQILELSSIDLEEMLHNQHQARSSLELSNIQRFKILTSSKIQGSGTLKYMLSSSTASSMGQLKYLVIEDCKVMEDQTCAEDLGEGEIISGILFPRLEGLLLKNLPIPRRFCIGSHI
uniref:Uncharacterized protein n=1 Tax=Quercus lobata TaxID=97700 RepID=A0A7N2L3P5_QUELO